MSSHGLVWIKATRSMQTGACVELAIDGEQIALRDSKNPHIAPFRYTRDEITAFIDGAKRGEFDRFLANE